MIELITIGSRTRWDSTVRAFPTYDVYYLSGYARAFELHGDGEPVLVYVKTETNEAVCVLMKRDISQAAPFKGKLAAGQHYDFVTPYGYGGFIFKREASVEDQLAVREELYTFLSGCGGVSVFLRFHPVLGNAHAHSRIATVTDLGKTIVMDLGSPELIWQNITSKNRNMIRKAEKSGVRIQHTHDASYLGIFREIYNATMDNDHAEAYYYFGEPFYQSIANDLAGHWELFYAELEGKIIAMSIMIFAGGLMNYHLSGSVREYRNLAPSNLLLYKAALWGCEQGMRSLHLGGGVGSGEDNLYKFKAGFNRSSDCRFSIGKCILNEASYKELTAGRLAEEGFDKTSSFFPLYRACTHN